MLRVFLDPVPNGSCHEKLRVVKLKKRVVQGLINTQFLAGSKGDSKFGGKSKAASRKALSKAASRKSKAASRKSKAASSKAASRKRKALSKSLSKAALSRASSRRRNKSRRLR
jgi:hypothetical protein